jgi:hypothetical protein
MKIRTFLGSSDKIFFNLMLFSSVKPSLGLVINLTRSVTLTPNLIFLFFWSRPLDFKSSFKLRKGHFPTVQFYEKLPSPTESHSPGVKQSHARTSGPIEKSFWTLALVDLITTNLKMHSPEKSGLSVHTCNFSKGEGNMNGAEVWSPKISTMKTNDNEH